MKRVVEEVGLSKSEVYRQQVAGKFPRSRPYPNNMQRRFFLSTEIEAWKAWVLWGDPVKQTWKSWLNVDYFVDVIG